MKYLGLEYRSKIVFNSYIVICANFPIKTINKASQFNYKSYFPHFYIYLKYH